MDVLCPDCSLAIIRPAGRVRPAAHEPPGRPAGRSLESRLLCQSISGGGGDPASTRGGLEGSDVNRLNRSWPKRSNPLLLGDHRIYKKWGTWGGHRWLADVPCIAYLFGVQTVVGLHQLYCAFTNTYPAARRQIVVHASLVRVYGVSEILKRLVRGRADVGRREEREGWLENALLLSFPSPLPSHPRCFSSRETVAR